MINKCSFRSSYLTPITWLCVSPPQEKGNKSELKSINQSKPTSSLLMVPYLATLDLKYSTRWSLYFQGMSSGKVMLSLEVSCVKKNKHLKIASEHTILTRVFRLLAEWKIKTWKMKNCNPEVISVNPGLAKHALPFFFFFFFLWLEVEIRNFTLTLVSLTQTTWPRIVNTGWYCQLRNN